MDNFATWQVTFECTTGDVRQTDIVDAYFIVRAGDAYFYRRRIDPDGNATSDFDVAAHFVAGRWILVERA